MGNRQTSSLRALHTLQRCPDDCKCASNYRHEEQTYGTHCIIGSEETVPFARLKGETTMAKIVKTITVDTPVEKVFGYAEDPANAPEY